MDDVRSVLFALAPIPVSVNRIHRVVRVHGIVWVPGTHRIHGIVRVARIRGMHRAINVHRIDGTAGPRVRVPSAGVSESPLVLSGSS